MKQDLVNVGLGLVSKELSFVAPLFVTYQGYTLYHSKKYFKMFEISKSIFEFILGRFFAV